MHFCSKKNKFFKQNRLQKHLHAVDLEDTDIADLADLSWRKEFDTACAVAKIIAERDTVLVVLYLSLGGEQVYIHRLGVREYLAEGIDVDGSHLTCAL